jgi:hypothetical protein
MTPQRFVQLLADIELPNVFNPYAHTCAVHDKPGAPAMRRKNLRLLLTSVESLEVETIWMGRDLGYRGGRRTGLALTDERHLPMMSRVYPGSESVRSTRGPEVAERTASEIWAVLFQLKRPPLLWNVFPFHPHEEAEPFSNRKFSSRELRYVDDINATLVSWLGIRRIVSIGNDAASYAKKFGVHVECVRHPSYGGVKEFRSGIAALHGISLTGSRSFVDRETLF